jgi:hypothetical protein
MLQLGFFTESPRSRRNQRRMKKRTKASALPTHEHRTPDVCLAPLRKVRKAKIHKEKEDEE